MFALWQLPIGERLNITLGGRVDDVVDVARLETSRRRPFTRLPRPAPNSTERRQRRQGADAVSALRSVQRDARASSPRRALATTREIDESLFNGRVVASVTGFSNDFSNPSILCRRHRRPIRAGHPDGLLCQRRPRETSGLEVGATIDVLPGLVKFPAAYTYLHAIDLATGLVLARRPKTWRTSGLPSRPRTDG